jgi:hypothetical protein
MITKKWYQSWTVWFNLIGIFVDAVNSVAQIVPIPAGFLTYVILLGNIALRLKTVTGIK